MIRRRLAEPISFYDEYSEKTLELSRIFSVISLCAAMEYGKRLGLDKARSAPIKDIAMEEEFKND